MFIAPVWLAWGLQRPLETKLEIVAPFALRLFILILTGLRLGSFDQAGFATDPGLHEAKYIAFTQAELSYSMIAATFPTARRMMLNLTTFYNGGHFGETVVSQNQSHSGSRADVFAMKSMRKGNTDVGRSRTGQDGGDMDDNDNDSQELIIRKDVVIEVNQENGQFKPASLTFG
ncbi:hypothetical protein LTR36_007375 [Oleoguttula mirabilis]|uniref:Rhodopsin domain-containing protein n=1 Tax=Oleoguttula mirabilis TaxID=1507867 RepID=A0AAV9JAG9_9PEZI|nr:hypothetical protein LTR36_007375 [Oleoguttula mirabilis]